MSFFSFRKPKAITTLQEQGGNLVCDVKTAASSVLSHIGSLLALLKVELAEYGVQQAKRLVLIIVACVLLLFAYAFACVCVCFALYAWLGSWLYSTGIVLLLNAVPGFSLLCVALRAKPAPLAECTRQELKNDLECLRILLKGEKTKS